MTADGKTLSAQMTVLEQMTLAVMTATSIQTVFRLISRTITADGAAAAARTLTAAAAARTLTAAALAVITAAAITAAAISAAAAMPFLLTEIPLSAAGKMNNDTTREGAIKTPETIVDFAAKSHWLVSSLAEANARYLTLGVPSHLVYRKIYFAAFPQTFYSGGNYFLSGNLLLKQGGQVLGEMPLAVEIVDINATNGKKGASLPCVTPFASAAGYSGQIPNYVYTQNASVCPDLVGFAEWEIQLNDGFGTTWGKAQYNYSAAFNVRAEVDEISVDLRKISAEGAAWPNNMFVQFAVLSQKEKKT